MTGDPIFTGPVENSVASPKHCESGFYTDFHFECHVQYPQQTTDNGARFNVSLTFDNETDPNNPDTHVVTNGTSLTVSFPSRALRGNVGKSVNITFILQTHTVLFCVRIKENGRRTLVCLGLSSSKLIIFLLIIVGLHAH